MPKITWKLRELMTAGKISNLELAAYIDKHPVHVSRMRSQMPCRLSKTTLTGLCEALNAIYAERGINQKITISDLMEYVE